ncbi:MAG: helix-turn-helix domain-containing protein [Planctomycetota bacterium]
MGPENRLAESLIAKFVGDSSAEQRVESPLVVMGVSGCGKSLMIRCIVHYWRSRADRLPVLVTDSSDWVRHVDESGEKVGSAPWRLGVDRISMFVMEDLEALEGHPRAQLELCLMLDELAARQIPAVATSKLAPSQMFPLEPRLISRLMGGTLMPVRLPSATTKRRFAEALDLNAVAHRTLEARLDDLVTLQQVHALGQQLRVCPQALEQRPPLEVEEVIQLCAKYFQLPVQQLRGKSRRQGTVFARHITMLVLRDLLEVSFTKIGEQLGGRDHSTVLHAYRKLSKKSKQDPKLCATIEELKGNLCRLAALQH